MSEMILMAKPWQGMTREEVSCAVAAGERPVIATELAASAPTGWIELMQKCWDQDPTNRPTFNAIHDALKPLRDIIGGEGAESERPSCPNKILRPNPLNSGTEMITHSSNGKLVMELQSVAERHKQERIDNVTTV